VIALLLALLIATSPIKPIVHISNVEYITYEDNSGRFEADMTFPNGASFVIGSHTALHEGYMQYDSSFMLLQCNDDQSFCK